MGTEREDQDASEQRNVGGQPGSPGSDDEGRRDAQNRPGENRPGQPYGQPDDDDREKPDIESDDDEDAGQDQPGA